MFKPILIGVVEFANDTRFMVQQIKERGACKITDLNTGKVNYAGSIANAYKSVCFQGDLDWRTNNTTSWRG